MVVYQSYLSIIKHFPNKTTDYQTSLRSPRWPSPSHFRQASITSGYLTVETVSALVARSPTGFSLVEPTAKAKVSKKLETLRQPRQQSLDHHSNSFRM